MVRSHRGGVLIEGGRSLDGILFSESLLAQLLVEDRQESGFCNRPVGRRDNIHESVAPPIGEETFASRRDLEFLDRQAEACNRAFPFTTGVFTLLRIS